MTSPDSALAAAFIQARNYRPFRAAGVDLIVLHSTEGGGSARSVAQWFASPKAPEASAHYVVGESEIIQCVREDSIAWHAPPVNDDPRTHEVSIGIEHYGWAKWAAEQWPPGLRTRSAELCADICRRHNVPAVYLDTAALLATERPRGITTHRAVSLAWHKSTHTDPGDGFDAPGLVRMVNEVLAGGGDASAIAALGAASAT